MTFQQLVYIVEVSKCGSINKAAQNLYLSQTAISSSIRLLEEELNTQLINRSNRGIEFTQEGKEFVNYAVSLLEQRDRVESLYKHSNKKKPSLQFSISSQRFLFAEVAFISFANRCESSYSLTYREVNMDTVIDDIYEHRSDIGIISLTDANRTLIEHLLDTRELEFHPILTSTLSVFCREGHPLTRLSAVEEKDLADYAYLYYDPGLGVAVEFSEEYQVLSYQKSDRSICSNSRAAIIDLIVQSDAYTIGSGLISQQLSPHLTSVPLAQSQDISIGWIKNKHHRLSDEAGDFVACLEQAARESAQSTKSSRQF